MKKKKKKKKKMDFNGSRHLKWVKRWLSCDVMSLDGPRVTLRGN